VTIDPLDAMPVYRQIAAIIRDRIISGEIPARRAIPSEKQMMGEYGAARETVRKAVRVLRDEGLVEIVQGRGAYVVPEDQRRGK
jgi:GntR family transcriptional regulator